MFVALMLTACSKDGESPEETQPVINIYVYSPEKPIITRGDVGNVKPIDNNISESAIKTLQIWVFEHGTENLVSYYSPETVYNLNNGEGVTYQLKVSKSFSEAFPKPNVDVYIVANAASCGLTELTGYTPPETQDENTQFRTKLEEAKIGSAYFGLTSPLTAQVPDKGLPMSGVLRDVAVTGSAPVFKISSVKLTRAVSKLRFIFSRDVGNSVKISSIYLKDNMIPKEEYLFLKADNSLYNIVYNDNGTYVDAGKELLQDALEDIKYNSDPLKYTYQSGQNAQDYENLISTGLANNELSGVGPYYLRETDKILEGTIRYQVQKGKDEQNNIIWDTEKTATFSMKAEAAGDFSRNHTWIVYAYYGVDGMQVVSVYSEKWNEVNSDSHNVHNW